MKHWLWIGGLVAAVAGVSWLAGGRDEPLVQASAESLFEVRRGPLLITVVENGFLTAKNSVQVQPQFKGSGTLTWLVEEGTSVAEGELLAEFEKTTLENDVAEIENSLIQYEAELEAAQASLEIQERDNRAAIEKAELDVDLKTLALRKFEDGDVPNQLRKLGLDIDKTASEHERATRRYAQVPELVEAGFMTDEEEEEERIRLHEAAILKDTANKELELYKSFTYEIELRQKRYELKDAERELENARIKADINLKEKQARLNQRERQVQTTRTRLEEQQRELGMMTIRAPAPGIVHYGDPERPWYSEQVKVGNSLRSGNTLFTLPDLREMHVQLEVHEADIDQIEDGQRVVVTVETHKGRTFVGEVVDVASVATTEGWGGESSKRFRVEVSLPALDAELRSGVTAKAEIEIEQLGDVVNVPIHAVFPESEQHLAFVSTPGGVEQRRVQIGKNNAHYVEVLAGLEPGEQVLLRDPRREGTDGGATEAGDSAETEEPGDAGDTGLAAELAGAAGAG